ncbi:hypothetical protein V8G54_002941 [Vigna mungo]|uniref:Uncharacterized protein n=1 Tax=Vigna mungo TaxID=3915 RepID=A0AAQ3PCD2_VIGMU
MAEAPVLALPDFASDFILETDASGSAMGVVLMQKGHPIAFYSKSCCPKLLKASAYVRELHVITAAIKKWRQYLLGHRFVIMTDHQSLKELMSQIIQTPEQQIFLSKLLGFDYSIQYKAGKLNVVVDALSRPQDSSSNFLIFSMPNFTFLEELNKSLHANQNFSNFFKEVQQYPEDHLQYHIHDNLLLYKGKIWINNGNPFINILLTEFHSTPLSGHMGITKTLAQLQENFFSHGMRNDVKHFVSSYSVCQQTKYETKRPTGLLQPLSVLLEPQIDLSLDFITCLPNFQGHTIILVVVDCFSKGAHFGMLPSHFTCFKVA